MEFGKYRLLEPIGSGGMAEVWLAELPGPEGFVKEVALKLIRPESEARPESVRMFAQEARLASRLTHANIVQVFDFGQCDGRYYLAMERVRGRTLREVVDRCRGLGLRLGVGRAVHICAEVARALAYAHGQEKEGRPAGVVHRDVSPQNVLLSFEGEVKLTDFGIARALGAPELTAPGTIKGKAAYMAPEQARGEAVDGRADVFAVGVMLWELCAGRRLFARESEAAALSALLSAKAPSPPSAWNEEVQPELDGLVAGALERDPARRTKSAEELAQALAELRLRLAADPSDLDLRALMRRLWPDGPEPVPRKGQTLVRAAEHTTVKPHPPPAATASTLTLARRTAAWLRRPGRRAIWAGAALVAMAAAGTAGTVAWHPRRGSTRAPRTPPVVNPPPGPSTPATLTANVPSRSASGTGDGSPGIDARRRLDVPSVSPARDTDSAMPAIRAPPGRAKKDDPFLHAEVLDPSVGPGTPGNTHGITIAPGTRIRARLLSHLDSRAVGGAGPVEAVLPVPLLAGGAVVLPAQTVLYGRARESGGRFHVRFTRLRLPDRTEMALEGFAMDRGDGEPGLTATARLRAVRPAQEAGKGAGEAESSAILLDAGALLDVIVTKGT